MFPNEMVLSASEPQLSRSSVRFPEATVTAPLKVLVPVSESPPVPLIVTPPLPLMFPAYVNKVLLLMSSVPLSTMVIVATLPVVPPGPSCTVPPEIVKVPVNVVSPVKVSTPVPVFVNAPPVPEISPANVVDALLPPTVRVFVSVPVPSEIVEVAPPAIEATVSE